MRRLRILSLHGGGYLGLATASFLSEVERRFTCTAFERFDLFCGTSTGAILALGLASGRDGQALSKLYRELGPELFPPGRKRGWWRRAFRSAYANDGLRRVLEREFGSLTLGDICEGGKHVAIPAFCISNGQPRVFKTDHGDRLSAHGSLTAVDVALASAAAPTYLPIHTIEDPYSSGREAFCDGGVYANDPSLIGLAEAVGYLGADPGSIEILSISTPRAFLGHWSPPHNLQWGFVKWGRELPAIVVDGTSESAHHVLRHIAAAMGCRYVRFQLRNEATDGPAVQDLDDASEHATNALSLIGAQSARTEDAHRRLAPFFCDMEELAHG